MGKMFWMTALVAGLFAGAANATIYDCKLRSQGRDMGWIAPAITIMIDDGNSRVLISDNLIRKYSVRRVLGELVIENAKRVTVKWELGGVRDKKGGNLGRVMYRATILKPSLKISVSALAAGREVFNGSIELTTGNRRGANGKCLLRR